MNPRRALLLSFILLVLSFVALASIPANAQTCTTANWPNYPNWYGTGSVIYYYIASDFGQELKDCSPSPDNEITEDHARNTIHAAAEIWNAESTGNALVYGGTYGGGDPGTVCNSISLKPAVLIEFIPTCADVSPADGVCDNDGGVLASVADSSTCSNMVKLDVFGAGGDAFNDTCALGGINWKLDGTATSYDLKSLLIHEFGHVLDSGHSTDSNDLMYFQLAGGGSVNGRNLHGWDQACGHNDQAGKDTRRYWRTYSTSTGWKAVAFIGTRGARSNSSGGFLTQSSGSGERYPLYFDSTVRTSYAGTNGALSFGSDVTLSSAIQDLMVAPHTFSPLELTGSTYRNRINYVKNYFDDTSDPPRLRYIRDDGYFDSGTIGQYSEYWFYGPGGPYYRGIYSHIPMTTAWDEVSDTTVFARVETDRDTGGGDIYIHAGWESGQTGRLNAGSKLSGSVSDPYTMFSYAFKTDQRVGVTCADSINTFAYNCVVAWNDRGIPDANVLYKYFRVNGNTIQWRSTVLKRSGAVTVGGIGAAFFDDQFWLAWKTTANDVAYTSNPESSSSYGGWSTVATLGRNGKVIDPPTWFYVPHHNHEAAVTWTEK